MGKTTTFLAFLALLGATATAQSGVRGTYWSTQSDGGGCQVPTGAYTVTDAVALGQGAALGDLQYRPGLCGQVLDISCDSGVSIPVVVVSTCNVGSDSCGIDMIAKTWNKATNNAAPGVTSCTVKKSSQNPLEGAGPICYHRTGSDKTPYAQILGVMNTGGQITSSATLAGKTGRRSNGAWFEFNADGSPLFTDDAEVVFTYESGGTATMKLKECKDSNGVQIFS